MAKRRQSGFEVVASMPWPLGIVLGLIAYIAIRHGTGWYFGATDNPYTSGLGKLATTGIYAPIGRMALIGCWIAAVASFIGRRSRRQLLDKQSCINSPQSRGRRKLIGCQPLQWIHRVRARMARCSTWAPVRR
jgi:restriction system protein